MKVYVSADIEGICGISHWDEASPEQHGYEELRERMTDHVAAVCEGLLEAGAEEILVKDAHGAGRNLFAEQLPAPARLVRGWSQHPLMMVQELDESFAGVAMVGYHARAGSGGNPLAHTLSSWKVAEIRVAGEPVSEFRIYGWASAALGVPVPFVSGDEALCAEVRAVNPAIETVAVMRGVGASTVSLHPSEARELLRQGAARAFAGELDRCRLALPERLDVEVRFRDAERAYAMSFYPGARAVDDHTVGLEAREYFDVLRFLTFVTW